MTCLFHKNRSNFYKQALLSALTQFMQSPNKYWIINGEFITDTNDIKCFTNQPRECFQTSGFFVYIL